MLGLQTRATAPLSRVCWGPNPGPHAWQALYPLSHLLRPQLLLFERSGDWNVRDMQETGAGSCTRSPGQLCCLFMNE